MDSEGELALELFFRGFGERLLALAMLQLCIQWKYC